VFSLIFPALTLLAVVASFTLSASAGLGGSLILVPALALVLGTKAGVALAALLLAGNNLLKILAFRRTLPWRQSLAMVVIVALGAALGARLLVTAPEHMVTVAVIGAFVATLVSERLDKATLRKVGARVLAFASGATSGFSGTSGPLKGVAIRSLEVDRQHFVGAASLVSFAGDLSKSAVYAEGGLLGSTELAVALAAVPLMVLGTVAGRWVNQELGERGFSVLFWTVMIGYSGRLLWGL